MKIPVLFCQEPLSVVRHCWNTRWWKEFSPPPPLIHLCVFGMVGQYVPSCDEDGYYRSHQCHSSSNQCWCVDRYGNEIAGSRTQGLTNCGKEEHWKIRRHKVIKTLWLFQKWRFLSHFVNLLLSGYLLTRGLEALLTWSWTLHHHFLLLLHGGGG